MSDYGNNISDYVNSALLSRILISWITGADTAVLPPFSNSPSPLPYTSVSCLLPYRKIPYSGVNVRIDGKRYYAASGDCLIFRKAAAAGFSARTRVIAVSGRISGSGWNPICRC